MNRHELIATLATRLGVTKKLAGEMVEHFIGIVTEELQKGHTVTVTGFGTFKVTKRKARKGVNPQNTDERIDIPAMALPTFRAGKTFKDKLR